MVLLKLPLNSLLYLTFISQRQKDHFIVALNSSGSQKSTISVPILEGYMCDFQKKEQKKGKQMLKKRKIFENLGKNVQILKIF